MIESLVRMMNCVLKEEIIPSEWETMLIKSIHKKGEKSLMKNKRGIFLTNVLSKVFEKALESVIGHIQYDKFQMGGMKGRSTVDNWLIVMAVRDTNKYLNKNTYMFFGDLVKCFDKLWLKDCLIDLHKAGVREREIRMLYHLNKKAKAKIITPAGTTEEIVIEEAAKQGTVFGSKLCCASTGRINDMKEKTKTLITPTIYTEALTYVDDMLGMGNKKTAEKVMNNCKQMEEDKCMEFSISKSKWMVMRTSRAKEEEINICMKGGMIQKCIEYNYLGNWINSKGNLDKQLDEMEKKLQTYVRDCNVIAAKEKVGEMELQAKILIYDKVIKTSLIYNLEAWSNIRKEDYERMEVMQGKILKRIIGLPVATPYWGLLYEMKMQPVRMEILYRKLMLYHSIINSDNDRMTKQLMTEQETRQQPDCWFSELKETAKAIGMEISKDKATQKMKSEWKKEVKEKVRTEVDRIEGTKIKDMKKLRHLQGRRAVDSYLTDVHNDDARTAIKIRLNMTDYIKTNYGMRTECILCGEDDSTEHIFSCAEIENTSLTIENLKEGTEMNEIIKLFRTTEEKRKKKMGDHVEEEIERAVCGMRDLEEAGSG